MNIKTTIQVPDFKEDVPFIDILNLTGGYVDLINTIDVDVSARLETVEYNGLEYPSTRKISRLCVKCTNTRRNLINYLNDDCLDRIKTELIKEAI